MTALLVIAHAMWQHWINAILGIWVIIIPFLALTGSALTWTLIVTGAVILVLGFWGGASGNAR